MDLAFPSSSEDSPPLVSLTLAGLPATVARSPSGRPRARVVFVHGAFVDHRAFGPWQVRFARAGFDAWAFARRGRLGVGPASAAGLGVEDYVDDCRAALDALPGDAPVVLVGHSLGGLLVQVLAGEGRGAAAVLLASAPPGMLTAQPIALPVFLPALPRILAGLPFEVPAGGCARVALNRMPEDRRAAAHATLVPESGRVYRAMMFGTVQVDVAAVRCPVLVIGGEEDHIVSTGLVRSTAARYGVAPRIHAGHAHWLLEEPGWEVICDEVLAWDGLPRAR